MPDELDCQGNFANLLMPNRSQLAINRDFTQNPPPEVLSAIPDYRSHHRNVSSQVSNHQREMNTAFLS